MVEPFNDREQAGSELAHALESYKGSNAIVLAIPRGGVVVGSEVASILELELDVIVPRKIGAPEQPELAIGAIASWGDHEAILDEQSIRYLNVSESYIQREIDIQMNEIKRRMQAYRQTQDPPNAVGRTVILVDDGIATGYTTRAAAVAIRKLNASRIVLAVPVAPPDSLEAIRPLVDEIICLKTPYPFLAVGYWYKKFDQVSDDEVISILNKSRGRQQY